MVNKFKFLVFVVLVGELVFRYIFSETFTCSTFWIFRQGPKYIRPSTF